MGWRQINGFENVCMIFNKLTTLQVHHEPRKITHTLTKIMRKRQICFHMFSKWEYFCDNGRPVQDRYIYWVKFDYRYLKTRKKSGEGKNCEKKIREGCNSNKRFFICLMIITYHYNHKTIITIHAPCRILWNTLLAPFTINTVHCMYTWKNHGTILICIFLQTA